MTTTVQPGSIVMMRERGEDVFWTISTDGQGVQGMPAFLIPDGAYIQRCVWKKGDVLESRGQVRNRPRTEERISSAIRYIQGSYSLGPRWTNDAYFKQACDVLRANDIPIPERPKPLTRSDVEGFLQRLSDMIVKLED